MLRSFRYRGWNDCHLICRKSVIEGPNPVSSEDTVGAGSDTIDATAPTDGTDVRPRCLAAETERVANTPIAWLRAHRLESNREHSPFDGGFR